MKERGFFLFTPAEGGKEAMIEYFQQKPKAEGKQIVGNVQAIGKDGAFKLSGDKVKPEVIKAISKALKAVQVQAEIFDDDPTPDAAATSSSSASSSTKAAPAAARAVPDDDKPEDSDVYKSSSKNYRTIMDRWPGMFKALCSRANLPMDLMKHVLLLD